MKRVVGGILALLIAMGIGRFAYTPLLPFMQADLALTDALAGYLATSNYAGYFVGAIGLTFFSFQEKRFIVLNGALFLNVLTTMIMGVTNEYLLLLLIRFISGVSSAVVFILASSIVLTYLGRLKKPQWSGLFYSGVGFGIAFSSISISYIVAALSWQATWLLLGVACIVLALFSSSFLKEQQEIESSNAIHQRNEWIQKRWLPWLLVAYGLEGVGYIVTGTFIVSIAAQLPTIQWNPAFVWLIVGLAAIPSCYIWSRMAGRVGYVNGLVMALGIQSIGIILPVLLPTTIGLSVSAFLFGMTFMGITTIVNTVARGSGTRILGGLTAMYAGGQMLGPTIAGLLMTLTDSYESALVFASICIVLATLIAYSGRPYELHVMEGKEIVQ
ncbi:YbfB/YjiJ family MFS transporter [Lysinibacillus sp. KU-BSD001]|uniref:YbfB/YjiJ family MFS transporter n=1 Tax=Lysinibacillus sp. KU-BSD001 TaxID=3141328 RepID=UPI0036E67D48